MQLDNRQRSEFETDGWTRIPAALPPDLVAASDRGVCERYDSGPKNDGITQYPDDPRVDDLLQSPRLERIAGHLLRGEVVLNSASILFKRPQHKTDPRPRDEHVDIMFTREEWTAQPRRVLCMLMVLLADLPLGRGNTYIRPGSHLQLADWLRRNGQKPIREHPTDIAELPRLPWQELQPVTGRAGDVIAFSTNLIHAPSPNLDREARRIMFVNFCVRGMMTCCSGNYQLRELRSSWREALRQRFRPDRRHLLDGTETDPHCEPAEITSSVSMH